MGYWVEGRVGGGGGVGEGRRSGRGVMEDRDGGARGTVGVPVQVTVPVTPKTQVEDSRSSSILRVFSLCEPDYYRK